METEQMTLMDAIVRNSRRKKASRAVRTPGEIEKLVDWDELVKVVEVLDKTKSGKGGRPPISFKKKLKMLFLQSTFNLSDEELEDSLIDRLSFQQFVGPGYDEEIPDFTTVWHFKEALVKHGLMDKIFASIDGQIERRGLILKKGTMVDAVILPSGNRPLSGKKRGELEKEPSSRIDTEARSTKKNGKKHFGYKGHIGVDVESKIIRKRAFTPANEHDRSEFENLISGDEKSVWGDKAYPKDAEKRAARELGIYYGVLDKGRRGRKLSNRQQKRNRQRSKVRAAVEHPFAFMRKKLKVSTMAAKNKLRNALRFDMSCIVYNVLRTSFLIKRNARLPNCA